MKRRLREIVRQFPENSIKLLLERPANVRDLLRITGAGIVEDIDFAALKPVKTHFVGADYRHIASDVVLRGPLRRRGSGTRRGRRGSVLVYVLIEHQSEPDRRMPLRLLEYLLAIYKLQEREARRGSRSPRHRLDPVLPVVFYTGTRRWEAPGSLVDLVEKGTMFAEFTPKFRTLFVNLPSTPATALTHRGGSFGAVLSLLKARRSKPGTFTRLLQRVVQALEATAARDRDRWRELLSYVHAMVYHYREEGEIAQLQGTIESSVRGADQKQEIVTMARTGAEALMARGREEGQAKGREDGRQEGRQEGREEGRQEGKLIALRATLLRLLGKRFGTLPEAVVMAVETSSDLLELEGWLERVFEARTLDEVEIRREGG